MKKIIVLSTLAVTSLLAFNASAADILARVISSTPVVNQVAVPRQVCNNQQVATQAPKSGAGALLGAVAGGGVGNANGNGNGRGAATRIWLIGGAMGGGSPASTTPPGQKRPRGTPPTLFVNTPTP